MSRRMKPLVEILLVYGVAGLVVLFGLTILWINWPVDHFDDRIYVNEEAKRKYHFPGQTPCVGGYHWMNLATDCYLWDGGTFNGTIKYWACTLPSKEKCLEAMRDSDSDPPAIEEMKPWGHSDYLVVMNGPGFYNAHYKTELWDVTTIQRGVYFERAETDRWMTFWAIDLDRNRLYYHRESGGFPADRYEPK